MAPVFRDDGVVREMERLAELAVSVGANVQAGQVVRVSADVVNVDLVRAVADAAYRRGARFVEVALSDLLVWRSQLLHARGAPQVYAPEWREAGIRELDEVGGAHIMIHGPTAPGLFDDLDPVRVSHARPPRSRAWREVEYRVNNTIIPGPNQAWADALYPELSPSPAAAKLWAQISSACRLHQPDPAVAWRRRFAELRHRADLLTGLGLDAVRLLGPGTDLLVGLAPTARWEPPTNINAHGIEHAWNLPSEEIYTVPDRNRVDGHVRLTRPAVVAERLVRDVGLSFSAGEVVKLTGGKGVEALREFLARDPGNRGPGELALVDGDSAVAKVGQTFGMIMLDENAASHLALGFGFPELVEPAARPHVNQSGDHLDLAIGSDQMTVIGIDHAGGEHLLLREGRWQLVPIS